MSYKNEFVAELSPRRQNLHVTWEVIKRGMTLLMKKINLPGHPNCWFLTRKSYQARKSHPPIRRIATMALLVWFDIQHSIPFENGHKRNAYYSANAFNES